MESKIKGTGIRSTASRYRIKDARTQLNGISETARGEGAGKRTLNRSAGEVHRGNEAVAPEGSGIPIFIIRLEHKHTANTAEIAELSSVERAKDEG